MTDLFKCGATRIPEAIRHIDFARTKHDFSAEGTADKRQIEYAFCKYRDSIVPPMIKVGDLMDWCSKNSQTSYDANEAFVIGSESSTYDEDLCYGFAFSTLSLLQMLKNVKTICIQIKLAWLPSNGTGNRRSEIF